MRMLLNRCWELVYDPLAPLSAATTFAAVSTSASSGPLHKKLLERKQQEPQLQAMFDYQAEHARKLGSVGRCLQETKACHCIYAHICA